MTITSTELSPDAQPEELADQKLGRTLLARRDEIDQAIEVDIDTMSVIGLAKPGEETPSWPTLRRAGR
jgi:hypothetical protein